MLQNYEVAYAYEIHITKHYTYQIEIEIQYPLY
jgi:hypothetical protein